MPLACAMLEGPGAAVQEDVQGAHSVRSWLPTWALSGASTPAWSDHTLQWGEDLVIYVWEVTGRKKV
jgi:hypothetical protein